MNEQVKQAILYTVYCIVIFLLMFAGLWHGTSEESWYAGSSQYHQKVRK